MKQQLSFPQASAAGREDVLIARLNEIRANPRHPVLTTAIGVVKEGNILFSGAVGPKQIGGNDADVHTKYRIASISKLITSIGVWQLIEKGLVDPDGDVSRYLGFSLRNPAYPHTPITTRMLMSHTSSIREAPGTYNIPYGHNISEFFTEGMPYHYPKCWGPQGEAPGQYFTYCNMNYCLLGNIIENVSGERFDQYMIAHVFAPMGLTCSYNVAEMPADVQAHVGTLYRKLDETGQQKPSGVWTSQQDDFTKGYPTADYSQYVLGTNGSLFGPMGSLRVSIGELCELMLMFCNGGNYQGVQILKPETVERMFAPVWTYDPALQNGDTYAGLDQCYGTGPHIITNHENGDRLVADRVLPFAGHSAEAYGLIGGMYFDREKGNGLAYFVAGIGSDMRDCAGKYSAFYPWEEALLTAGTEFAGFDY